MKRTAAFRFASDICFYYAILSIFPSFLPLQRPMALFAAASLIVSLAAVYCPWAPLRFALSLLPGLAFLQARLCLPLAFPALAWLYLILVLTAGRFHIWLEGYRRSYWIMLWSCLFSMLSSVLLNLIKPGVTLILPAVYYAAAFLFLGVISLRRLQMNAEMDLRWNLINSAAAIGIPLLAAGCSWLLCRLILLKPMWALIRSLLRRFIAWLINTLFPINPNVPEPTPTPSPSPTPIPEEAVMEPGWATPEPKINFDWQPDLELLEKAERIGVIALLALLVIVLGILILLHTRHNRAKPVQEEFLFEETGEGRLFRRRKKGGESSALSNARQIRRYYRRYLLLMQKRGLEIGKANTSREILDEAGQTGFSAPAERLRELYLKARYDDGDTVTREDVQEADACLQQILEDQSGNN